MGRLLRKKVTSVTPLAHLPVERADPRAYAASSYVPQPIEIPVAQFIANQDLVSTRVLEDPRLGWRDMCRKGFEVRRIASTHPTLFLEELPGELVSGLQELLTAAQAK